ncbi:MAG TPA: hypothetical protein VFF65_08860, partial [Phycisphaerales bacterium]|nr:hypothetical protein [Phycisphaerales bacterium]
MHDETDETGEQRDDPDGSEHPAGGTHRAAWFQQRNNHASDEGAQHTQRHRPAADSTFFLTMLCENRRVEILLQREQLA